MTVDVFIEMFVLPPVNGRFMRSAKTVFGSKESHCPIVTEIGPIFAENSQLTLAWIGAPFIALGIMILGHSMKIKMNQHQNEGWLAGTYHTKIINPIACIHCRLSFTSAPVFSLGAPYNGLIHAACLPHFDYSGRYPHALPAVFYERQPLRHSQDDNGFVSIRQPGQQ